MTETRSKLISIIIFSTSILVALFSFNQILFPKLLIELTSNYQNTSVNIFEFGIWAIPLLISIIVFGIIWFSSKSLKIPIRKYIKPILDFDLSKKVTILSLIVLFSVYLVFSVEELFQDESYFDDYFALQERVNETTLFSGEEQPIDWISLKIIFLKISQEVFNNIRFLPFLSSIALLSITYLFSVKISGKRISGIVALIIVIQSNLFRLFDTTASYENFWTAFFLLSLYLILKKPYLSPISYIMSILTKLVSFLFLPILISLILSTDKSIKKKKKILFVYCFFPILFIASFFTGSFTLEQFGTVDMRNVVTGFSALSMGLRFDGLILLSFFPILFLLYTKSRNNFRYANFLLVSITMMLLIPPIISGVTGLTNQPYRLVPLVPLFAISVGYLFSKKI